MIEAMVTPVCDVCDVHYKNMQDLTVHMVKVHGETDSMRITRYENLLMAPRYQEPKISFVSNMKSCDCTECGIVFKSGEDMTNHIEKYHNIKHSENEKNDVTIEEVKVESETVMMLNLAQMKRKSMLSMNTLKK